MNTRILGRTGIRVSEIGLGSEAFVNQSEKYALTRINVAVNAGDNYHANDNSMQTHR